MKKIMFLAHDPGGYDVVFPVYNKFTETDKAIELYCTGPAGLINTTFQSSDEHALSSLEHMIAYNQIAMLVTGTSWGNETEIHAIQLAKNANIVTVSILDYWANYSLRFRNSKGIFSYPDIYIVMDQLAREEAIAAGLPSEIIRVLGHPGLDCFITEDKQERPKVKLDRMKRILFLSQPISQVYGKSLGYTETSVLEDCLQTVSSMYDISVQVKFHPKDDRLLQDKYQTLSINGDLKTLIPQYDLVIGMSTMGLLHAVLAGVPSISYQPQLIGQDLCIATKLKLIPLVKDIQDLKGMIDSTSLEKVDFSNHPAAACLIWRDGKSTERIIQFLQGGIT